MGQVLADANAGICNSSRRYLHFWGKNTSEGTMDALPEAPWTYSEALCHVYKGGKTDILEAAENCVYVHRVEPPWLYAILREAKKINFFNISSSRSTAPSAYFCKMNGLRILLILLIRRWCEPRHTNLTDRRHCVFAFLKVGSINSLCHPIIVISFDGGNL